MKKTLNTLFTLALCGSFAAADAQTALPYRTGFDTPAEKTGWNIVRKGSTDFYSWVYGPGAAGTPGGIYHDYPVGNTDGDVVTDWFISPKFAFPSGGLVDTMSVIVYAIIGSATPDDEFGVYLLQGSADPATATVTKLADLTVMVSTSMTWKDTGKFTIPPTAGDCYIALKYRATNNWFTINADNFVIKGAPVSVPEQPKNKAVVSLFPNPVQDKLYIRFAEAVTQPYRFSISDLMGREVYSSNLEGPATLDMDLATGTYIYKLQGQSYEAVQTGRIAVQ